MSVKLCEKMANIDLSTNFNRNISFSKLITSFICKPYDFFSFHTPALSLNLPLSTNTLLLEKKKIVFYHRHTWNLFLQTMKHLLFHVFRIIHVEHDALHLTVNAIDRHKTYRQMNVYLAKQRRKIDITREIFEISNGKC